MLNEGQHEVCGTSTFSSTTRGATRTVQHNPLFFGAFYEPDTEANIQLILILLEQSLVSPRSLLTTTAANQARAATHLTTIDDPGPGCFPCRFRQRRKGA